jgi:hypothetical protein
VSTHPPDTTFDLLMWCRSQGGWDKARKMPASAVSLCSEFQLVCHGDECLGPQAQEHVVERWVGKRMADAELVDVFHSVVHLRYLDEVVACG